jgi:ATP-dependent DNA helicase RecG
VPNPEYHYDFSGVMLNFKWESEPVSGEMSGEMSGEILKSIQNNPKITIPELAQIFDVTDRTIERYLRKLRKENKIERVGSTKSGSWKII